MDESLERHFNVQSWLAVRGLRMKAVLRGLGLREGQKVDVLPGLSQANVARVLLVAHRDWIYAIGPVPRRHSLHTNASELHTMHIDCKQQELRCQRHIGGREVRALSLQRFAVMQSGEAAAGEPDLNARDLDPAVIIEIAQAWGSDIGAALAHAKTGMLCSLDAHDDDAHAKLSSTGQLGSRRRGKLLAIGALALVSCGLVAAYLLLIA